MISLYSGTPGSGKSYHATKDAVTRALFGYRCITNFPVDCSAVPGFRFFKRYRKPDYVPNEELSVDYLVAYAAENHTGREGETLLVIDEAGLFFNSRDWQSKGRRAWLDFFSQHRKLGYDVILVSQSMIMLDKQIRAFVEDDHRHRKLSQLGLLGIWLRPFCTFISVNFWLGSNMRLGADYIKFHRWVARCYNTKEVFANGGIAIAGNPGKS